MVYAPSFLVLACSLSAIASPLGKRTVAQIEADIADISSQVNNLDTAINTFPDSGGSLAAALAIHNDAGALESAITKGTTDVQSTGPVNDADGNTILASVQALQPNIIDALHGIVAKKPAFDALPLGGVSSLVRQDLNTLNSDTTAFENALIAAAPTDLKDDAMAVKAAIDVAFASAVAAYA